MISEQEFYGDEDHYSFIEQHWVGHNGQDFNGYAYQGYIGNSDRNYVTDAWLLAGANALGWSLTELDAWICSRYGRWALEAQPMTQEAFQEQMAEADVDTILNDMLEEEFSG